MTRAAIYRRQSLDRAGDELGIDRQLKECERVAEARGLDVVQVITDNDVSASKRGRQGYADLIRLMTSGSVDVVLILRVDRLLRLNDELEELIQLVERHPVKVVTVEGDIDLTTPQGRLIARILVSVARSEMETKSERHKLANSQKAAAGKPHGSRRPYGYQADLVTICEPEAAVLREMARRVILGHAYNEIAYWANENGHLTTQGKLWYPVTVRNLLLKKRYAGIRVHNGVEYPGIWQPVFEPEAWSRLQLSMKLRQAKGHGKPVARKYLLTGLLYCGVCGNALNGARKRDRDSAPARRGYFCRTVGDTQRERGCGGVRRNADALEDWITEAVFYRLDTPELGELLGDTDIDVAIKPLLDERAAQQQRVDALVDDYATGLLSRDQFTRAKAAAETELQRVEGQLEAANRELGRGVILGVGESVRQAWQSSESDEWRRTLLGLLIKAVRVNPGQRKPAYKQWKFDGSLIEIEWLA